VTKEERVFVVASVAVLLLAEFCVVHAEEGGAGQYLPDAFSSAVVPTLLRVTDNEREIEKESKIGWLIGCS